MQCILFLFTLAFTFEMPFVVSDSTVGQAHFPKWDHFTDQAHFYDKDGVFRGGVPKYEDFIAEEHLYCTGATEMINATVADSHGYCSSWRTEKDGGSYTSAGNCSCQVEADNREYCDTWYCQKTITEGGSDAYSWQRCVCNEEYKILDTEYALACDAWVCEEGESADDTFSELWLMDEATDESSWDCTVRRWRTDITGVFCDHYEGDETHSTNYFKMTGCSCIEETDDQDYCLQYKCKTYSMHKCNINLMGCGVLAAAIPVTGFFGGICFVCLVYSMFFSGPKNTVWDNMGCFDFEWYDGLGCWFNFVHGVLSGSYCCQILIWVMPCWKGGMGTVGMTGIAVGAYYWAGVYGLVGAVCVYVSMFLCFKFMTPKLYPHCRCRINHHSHSDAGFHVNFHTSGFIEVPHKEGLSWQGSEDRTLEFWLRPIAHHQCTLFEKPAAFLEDGSQDINFRLDLTSKGHLHLFCKRRHQMRSAHESWVLSDAALEKNRWSHIAVVYSAAKKEVAYYINGTHDSTHRWTPGPSNQEDFLICHGDADGWYHGRLAEVRVWSTARDKNEIDGNKCKRIRGMDLDLLLYLRLDEEKGKLAQDRSLNPCVGQLREKVKFVAMHAPDIEEEPQYPTVDLMPGPRDNTWKTATNVVSLALTRDFTLEAWIRCDDSPDFGSETQMIMDKGSRAYGLGRVGSKLCLWMSELRYDTHIDLSPNQWMHVAVSVDGDLEHQCFLNGKAVGTALGVKKSKRLKEDPLTIGYRSIKKKETNEVKNTDFWKGDIVEARVWGFARGPWNMLRTYKVLFVDDLEETIDSEVPISNDSDSPVLVVRHLDTQDVDLMGCFHLIDYGKEESILNPTTRQPKVPFMLNEKEIDPEDGAASDTINIDI